MKILIVDDAGFIREMLARVFQEAGHEIVGEATTGAEAIALAETSEAEIIIMDLVLPDINGLEATVEILKKHPEKKVIACSSLEEDWVAAKALELGCSCFLKKPFSRDQVLRAIDFSTSEERLVQHG